ncbi:Mitochondrial import inner membrane translocase subunit TIM14 [Diplonema papillatum]|nr:Mitochondrial import inner membrane translocase subunit TIM14 [Diplonema papillatum]|eukprot:gene4426-6858_t
MSHLIAVSLAAVSGLYAARIGLRVAQQVLHPTAGANYEKGGKDEFMQHMGGFDDRMTADEARKVLGVSSLASADEIKKTHRALMMRNHADQGGSPFLASKINEARATLMVGGK